MSAPVSHIVRDWLHKINEPLYLPLEKIILAYDVKGSLVIHGKSDSIDINDVEPNWRIVTPEILAEEYDFENPKSICQQPYVFFYNQSPVLGENHIGGYIYPNWMGPCWYLMPV